MLDERLEQQEKSLTVFICIIFCFSLMLSFWLDHQKILNFENFESFMKLFGYWSFIIFSIFVALFFLLIQLYLVIKFKGRYFSMVWSLLVHACLDLIYRLQKKTLEAITANTNFDAQKRALKQHSYASTIEMDLLPEFHNMLYKHLAFNKVIICMTEIIGRNTKLHPDFSLMVKELVDIDKNNQYISSPVNDEGGVYCALNPMLEHGIHDVAVKTLHDNSATLWRYKLAMLQQLRLSYLKKLSPEVNNELHNLMEYACNIPEAGFTDALHEELFDKIKLMKPFKGFDLYTDLKQGSY